MWNMKGGGGGYRAPPQPRSPPPHPPHSFMLVAQASAKEEGCSGGPVDTGTCKDHPACFCKRLAAHKGTKAESALMSELFAAQRVQASGDHPHVVKILHVGVPTQDQLWVHAHVAMDRGECDLFTYLDTMRAPMKETECRWCVKQLVEGLEHLHTKAGLAHGDVKPENAVLMPAGAGRRLVLVDFGKSKPVGRRITASSGYGTSAYTAPETVADDCDSAQCWAPPLDMWSLGILLVVLLTKHYPWKVSHPSYDRRYAAWASNHGKGEFGPVARALLELGFVGPDCLDFLVRLLDPDPATRMTLAGAAAHKWCTDG